MYLSLGFDGPWHTGGEYSGEIGVYKKMPAGAEVVEPRSCWSAWSTLVTAAMRPASIRE